MDWTTSTALFTVATISRWVSSGIKWETSLSWRTSIGLLNRGHATGYLYCSTAKKNGVFRFEPYESRQSAGSHKYDPESRAEAFSFQELADHWYAYDQGPSCATSPASSVRRGRCQLNRHNLKTPRLCGTDRLHHCLGLPLQNIPVVSAKHNQSQLSVF